MGKQARNSHSGTLPRSEIAGYRYHCDLAGPFPVPTPGDHCYAMVLLDDSSRKNWVVLLKNKITIT